MNVELSRNVSFRKPAGEELTEASLTSGRWWYQVVGPSAF